MNVNAVVSSAGAKVVFQEPESVKQATPATKFVAGIIRELDESWLPRLYKERILQLRTRAHHLPVPANTNPVEIQHTLLGVELKVGKQRLLCPDLATARYLAVFARMGCTNVAVPYDITQISTLADGLESAWHRMLLLVEHVAQGRTRQFRQRLRRLLIDEARREILEAGAGSAIPKFNQNTKQRRV